LRVHVSDKEGASTERATETQHGSHSRDEFAKRATVNRRATVCGLGSTWGDAPCQMSGQQQTQTRGNGKGRRGAGWGEGEEEKAKGEEGARRGEGQKEKKRNGKMSSCARE
jgi:hypothetical protein